MVKLVTVADFQRGLTFLRIERAVAAILANVKVVAPVEMLVRMDLRSGRSTRDDHALSVRVFTPPKRHLHPSP